MPTPITHHSIYKNRLAKWLCTLVLFILGHFSAYGQLHLHQEAHLFAGKNILKVEVNPDGSAWVLGEDNFVGFIDTDNSTKDFTELFASKTSKAIVDIGSWNRDTVLFATKGDYVLVYDNGDIKKADNLNGIHTPYIQSIGFHRAVISLSQDLENVVVFTEDSVAYFNSWPKDFSDFETIYSPISYRPNRLFQNSNKSFLLGYSGFQEYCQLSPETSQNLFRHSFYQNRIDVRIDMALPVQTALGTNRFAESIYMSPTKTKYYYATKEKGLYYLFYNYTCEDKSLSIPFFQQHFVQCIEELNAMMRYLYNGHSYILVGTDKGLFVSSKNQYHQFDSTFHRVELHPEIQTNRIAILSSGIGMEAICDRAIFTATTDGIFKFKFSLSTPYPLNSAFTPRIYTYPDTSQYDTDIKMGFDTAQELWVWPSYVDSLNYIQWQKDGEDIIGADSNRFIPTESGRYRALTYSACDNIELMTAEVVVLMVDAPQFTFDYPDSISICHTDSYEFQVEGNPSYHYQWYFNGSPIEGANGQRYTAAEAGEYHVGVSLGSGTVYHSKRVYLELIYLDAPERNAESGTFCHGSTIPLTLHNYSGLETIQWYFNDEPIEGANGETYVATQEGYYNISLSYKGCTAISEPYLLRYDPPLEINFSSSIKRALCTGEESILEASVTGNTDGLSYLWSTGASTPSIRVSQAGTYQLTVTNAMGCTATTAIAIEELPALPSFLLPDTVVCALQEERIRLEAPRGFASYQWNGQESLQSWIDITEPGDYELVVTDANGCSDRYLFSVTPYCEEINIPNIFSPNGDGINDTWNISGLEGEEVHIKLFSRTGQLLIETTQAYPAWDGTIHGGTAPEGAYYYVIERKNSCQVYKGSLTLIR